MLRRLVIILAGASLGLSAQGKAPTNVIKTISYQLLEDYNKGADLHQVELDFQLMRSLGIDTWRGSFGWDDYEPQPGGYDFSWLHSFAALADSYGIKLRPYVAYTAPWAADGGNSSTYWSYPPTNLTEWYQFLTALSAAMSVHPNVLSYELYNEVDSTQWWNGTPTLYNDVLKIGAAAIRAGNPRAKVLMAGLVFPDYDWLMLICDTHANGSSFDVAPFHAYPETWDPSTVETFLDTQYYDYYVPEVQFKCGGQPIWMNEMGYATTPGKTEYQQSYWWARAFATYLSDAHISELGIYQIRDVPPGVGVIGGSANYHLGITGVKRTPKLAYYTIGMLVKLLPSGTITTADHGVALTVTAGTAVEPYYHLFQRPDGHQILFVYDKQGTPVVSLTLTNPGSTATLYGLDGSGESFTNFDGASLTGVQLAPHEISIFDIAP